MKKITLLNFPTDTYLPIKNTNEMREIFRLQTEQDRIKNDNQISEVEKQLIVYKDDLNDIPEELSGYTLERVYEERKERLQDLKEKYSIDKIGNKNWEAYHTEEKETNAFYDELNKKVSYITQLPHNIKWTERKLSSLKEKLAENIPFLPLPLSDNHVRCINEEIKSMEKTGYDLESYQLITTEFYPEGSDRVQKCYSGVLFTWVKRSNNHNPNSRNKSKEGFKETNGSFTKDDIAEH